MAQERGYPLVTWVIFFLAFSTAVYCQVNAPPIWEEDLIDTLVTKGLDEDVLPGTVVGSLRARDPEGGKVTYGIQSDIFSINQDSGQVTLIAGLDRENRTRYPITVTAEDDVGNKLLRSYIMVVRDVNDQTPTFREVPVGGYSARVREDALIGITVLGNIKVTDGDAGPNSEIRLACFLPENRNDARASCSAFDVSTRKVADGEYIGTITVKSPLDYESTSSYVMNIVALDNGSPQRSSTTRVLIDVQDVQDSQPRFLNTPVVINIFERIPRDVVVGKLIVQDGSRGATRDLRVKIAEGEDGLGWFRVGAVRVDPDRPTQYIADILTNGNIDREAWDGVYTFDVEAIELADNRETQSRARTTVQVTISDRNDNAPSFNQQNFDIMVPEGLNRGSPLPGLNMVVSDGDLAANAEFGLTIENDRFNSFSLSQSKCTGECAISLLVDNSRAFDYEDSNYRTQIIRIIARETTTAEQLASTATVTVRLQDSNDNTPEFTQTSYSLSVREDRPVGSLLATILATDKDSGSFGSLKYRLVGPGGDTFSVNENTGEIRLARRLDYEQRPSYSLLYEARDEGGRVTRVGFEVTVLNFNDQGPVFTQDNYNIVYDEGSMRFMINITAVDREQSSIVTYRILGGNERNLFNIDRYTGIITLRRPITFSDTGGTGFLRVMVEASDSGNPPQTTTIPVTITVRDVNNRPRFTQGLYTASIQETAPSGQSVTVITATDTDTGAGGVIRYQISAGSAGKFTIDRTSGLVRVAPNANFDLQTGQSSYRMVIQAIDAGSPPLVGETQLIVTVTDANNKMPEFIQNVYIASILETSPSGTSVLRLMASDPDSNRRLEYSIRQSSVNAKDKDGRNLSPSATINYRNAFRVDSASGVISTRQTLKREDVGEVSFIAQVADTNAQSPPVQTATATVIITIESSAPREQLQFPSAPSGEDPTFRVTIPEEEEVGYIVYNLVAIDPNTNQEVTNYVKVFGTDPMNYFFVDRTTGRVTLNRRLDFERLPNKELTFQVRATSSGGSPLTALARMVVTVQDINDNSPIFNQESYRFTILEGQQFPVEMRVLATDADSASFGEVRYSLSGKGRELFYIDPVRGTISVARNATLDRELIEGGVFNLLVKATDTPRGRTSDQRQTDVPLSIVVEDVNDNAPRFGQAQYNFYTRDTSRAGSALGEIKATDADVMSNGEITYSIRSGNIDDLFVIDRTSGTLRNTKDLLGYAQVNPYSLEVVATDNGAPPLLTSVVVNVFISDLQGNDDVPRILAPAVDGKSFSLPENATFGTVVTTINAVARGSSTPGTVYYTFFNNPLLTGQDFFAIDPFTGVITLKKPVDREKQDVYQLIVVVENKLASTQNRRSLFVNVTDVNDNIPSFLGCPGPIPTNPLVVSVEEEGPAVMEVTRLRACDRDVAPFNATYYYIFNGNEPLPGQTMSPFTIDKTSGVIRTQVPLDREVKRTFKLYVKVSENPNLDLSTIVFNETDGTIQQVWINVQDVDDNGPSFGTSTSFSTGVLATAPYHTKLMIIRAQDQDSADAAAIYSLENVMFYGEDQKGQPKDGAFTIGKTSGIVYTNLHNYLDFQNGYFVMDVVAADTKGRISKATLHLYVLRSTQRLKFIFEMPPEDLMSRQAEFIRLVNTTISPKYRINADAMHYASEDGEISKTRTDLCFHLVSENRVVDPDVALKLFDEWEDDELKIIFRDYKVRDTGLCSIRTVTYWWSNHWWLWWILIALTLLMILISLIAICCLCWCWDKYKRKLDAHKPYVVLDPLEFQDANREYEWQEKTVKM